MLKKNSQQEPKPHSLFLSLSTDNNPEKLTLELKHLFFEIILPIETQIPYTFAALICHRMMLYIYN